MLTIVVIIGVVVLLWSVFHRLEQRLKLRAERNKAIFGVSTGVDAILADVAAQLRPDGSNLEDLIRDGIRRQIGFEHPRYREFAREVLRQRVVDGDIEDRLYGTFVRLIDVCEPDGQPATV